MISFPNNLLCGHGICAKCKKKMSPTTRTFDSKERKTAELPLIKEAQVSMKVDKNFSTWERQLSLFTDNNRVLRYLGIRIYNA